MTNRIPSAPTKVPRGSLAPLRRLRAGRSIRAAAVALACWLPWTPGAAAAGVPQTVAPGDPTLELTAASVCPTFHWGSLAGARRFELVVYDLARIEREITSSPAAGAEQVEDGVGEGPDLALALPGSVTSWTPTLERCLAPGGRWAWSVRAQTSEGPTGWSAARLFRTPNPPSPDELRKAVEVIRAYLPPPASDDSAGEIPARTPSAPTPRLHPVGASDPGTLAPEPAFVALSGEVNDTSGITYGVQAVTHSPDGAAIHALNTQPGGLAALLEGELSLKGPLVCTGCVGVGDIDVMAVGTAQIEDASVGAADLAPNSVLSSHVVNGSITSADIAPLTLTNGQIAGGAGIDPAKIAGTAATLTGSSTFDGGTLRIDAGSDRVGVGALVPEADLDVRGDLQVEGDLLWRVPRSSTLTVPAAAFNPEWSADPGVVLQDGNGYLFQWAGLENNLALRLIAPISLPIGATVTRLACYRIDSSGSLDLYGFAYLYRRAATSTFAALMAQVELSTSSVAELTIAELEDTTIASPEIGAGTQTYLRLDWYPGGTGRNLRFYGCGIDYTISGVGPAS